MKHTINSFPPTLYIYISLEIDSIIIHIKHLYIYDNMLIIQDDLDSFIICKRICEYISNK